MIITDKTYPVQPTVNLTEQQKKLCDSMAKAMGVPELTPKDFKMVTEQIEPTINALTKQVGGGHYKEFGIQPVEYIHANNLSFLEGNVVKYITRHKSKNGIEDIKKVIHYCELIIELEYNQKKEPK